MIFAFERANLKKKSWILVDQSDIWTPKCTEEEKMEESLWKKNVTLFGGITWLFM